MKAFRSHSSPPASKWMTPCKKMICQTLTRPKFLYPPLCSDCKYFVTPILEHYLPNSWCKRFDVLTPCMNARTQSKLCGIEGKYFELKEDLQGKF